MKINKLSQDYYKIYIYLEDNELSLTEQVKKHIKKLQKHLKLKGFYKVTVCSKEYGLFIKLIKIEDTLYRNTLDLKIEINNDIDIYFKTKDYFSIKEYNNIYYYSNYYYALLDNSISNIFEKIEFGEFIFDTDLNKILKNSYII